MSTRALRKLQREQAEKEIQKQVAGATIAQEEDESEDDEPQVHQPRNAFDMLNEIEDAQESEEDGAPSIEPTDALPEPSQPSQASRSKKKKKKQKKKAKEKVGTPTEKEESGDEIDRALKELAAKNSTLDQHTVPNAISWETMATKLLAINQKNLNPTNEMRSLFGNIALEGQEAQTPPRNQRRREINLQGGLDVATVLTGRHNVASRGKELGALADRRNVFLQGKKEWPLATSGGLGMEPAESDGFEKQYNIVHNQQYQETQMYFRSAVESMQAESMIGLLIKNPYHIATLLQVSEIMKHQGDHSVSGDLLERALFNFGRSVHSSFPAATREGTARLDFDKPANRELYLTVWRYIRNLEMRGTWRTAFEWAKMLLQFNTMSDPYGVTLMIDQLALRGRQHAQLLELASADGYGHAWTHLPNIQISLALAYLREKQPREARKQLAYAMHHYPYILSALASALEIQPIPKSLWGKVASSEGEKLYSELYVTRARDLWNTPENTALIDEVANTLSLYEAYIKSKETPPPLQISLEEARHIMLLEVPALIALLPRRFTNMPTSSSDVLPPPSSLSDFTARAPNVPGAGPVMGANAMQAIFNAAGNAAGAPIAGANGLLNQILGWFRAPAGPNETTNELGESQGQAAFRAMRDHLGGEEVPDEVVENMIRMHLDPDGDDTIHAEDLGFGDGQPMVGDWDYYDSDQDSIPALEDIPDRTEAQSRNPRAAMVEEGDSDEDVPHQTTSGRSLLRHADSSDDDEPVQPHRTPARSQPQPAPSTSTTTPAPATVPAASSSADPGPDGDPQRIQRYLLTAGLASLKSDSSTLSAYVLRLRALRKQQQDWVIGIVRQQGGKDLAERVQNAL